MGIDEELIKKEEKNLNEKLKKSDFPSSMPSPNKKLKSIVSSISEGSRKIEFDGALKIQKLVEDEVEERILRLDIIRKVSITNTPKVFVDFPKVQKIAGMGALVGVVAEIKQAISDRSEAQKVSGQVRALVKFPDIQKVSGDVKAIVDFPKVQKISGQVRALVKFPDKFDVKGKVDTDIPQVLMGNQKIVPIAIFDGKRFVNPFSSTVQSQGRVVAVLEKVYSQLVDGAFATGINGGPVTVGIAEVEMTFIGTTRSIMIQSDPDNTGRVWIGKTGITNSGGNAMVQLEPGDAISFDLNDVSSAVYAISDTASQTVHKMALT